MSQNVSKEVLLTGPKLQEKIPSCSEIYVQGEESYEPSLYEQRGKAHWI